MDTNEHTMDGKLWKTLEAEGVGLVEFSHKRWGVVTSNTSLNGSNPIYAGYRSLRCRDDKLLHIFLHK